MTDIDIRMVRARTQLIQKHPFFGSLAMRLKVEPNAQVESMATEGKHLFYNPGFIDTVDEPRTLTMCAHQVVHCALGHHIRRGGRDELRWNVSCDYAANNILVKAGFELWEGAYYDPQYGDLNAEQIYRILEQKEAEQQQSGEGDEDECSEEGEREPGEGGHRDGKDGETEGADESSEESGEGDQKADQGPGQGSAGSEASASPTSGDPPGAPGVDVGGGGQVWDAAPEHDQGALEEAAAEWEVYTRQAANILRRAGEGRLPGWGEEVVKTLNDPRTDWRQVLRRFIDYGQTKDYTWTRPNRRYSPLGYFAPGTISDGLNHVAAIVDSSASVNTPMLTKMGTELQAALDDGAIDKVTVIFADTAVRKTVEYVKGDQIDFTVHGRGGTRFAPSFEWIDENLTDVAVAIYFTDLECSDYGPEPAYPVLWAVHGYDARMIQMYIDKCPFGECMILQ